MDMEPAYHYPLPWQRLAKKVKELLRQLLCDIFDGVSLLLLLDKQ